MKRKTINALLYINILGYDKTQWGLVEDIDVRYFIRIEHPPYDKLPGVWLWVWLKSGDAHMFERLTGIADKTINIDEDNETILLYRMES